MMRLGTMTSVLAATAALGAAPAAAQEPSVDSYLCTFAGKCGGEPAEQEVTREAPATKGFRLARGGQTESAPAPTTKGFRVARGQATEAAPETRGFRVARPTSQAPAPRRPAAAAPRPSYARPAAAAAAGAGVRRSNRADLMIAFELGSDRMTPAGAGKAKMFAQALLAPELRDKRFAIEGHTDSIGSADSNLDLSRRRAQAVADFLVAQGVDASRLEVKGLGSEAPLPGRRASDPAQRRVEAELIS